MAKSSKKKPTATKKKTSATAPGVPDFARVHLWQVQAVRDVLVVLAAIGIFAVGYLLRAVTVPLLVALLLAYLFEPLIERMCQNPKITRQRAVAGLLTLIIAVVLVFLVFVTPLVVGQTANMVQMFRNGEMRAQLEKANRFVPEELWEEMTGILAMLPEGDADEPDFEPDPDEDVDDAEAGTQPGETAALTEQRVQEIVAAEIDRARGDRAEDKPADWIGIARGGAHAVSKAIATIVSIGLLTCLIPFYFFFFSLWYPQVVRFGRTLIPEKNRQLTHELLRKMDEVVSGFVRGRIIISLIMGVMLSFGWFVCGVPHAVVLGLVIGVFCAIPYLGGIGIPIALGLAFFKHFGPPDDGGTDLHWAWWGVGTVVWFFVVQFIEGWLLTPAIAGKATRLDPVTILAAVLAGGSVMGVYGMLLAIPVAACLKILVTEILLPKFRDWAAGRIKDPLPIDPS
jgi:predicted PurR-regulated permease PerM